jgi:protein PhnA
MSVQQSLIARANGQCELCKAENASQVFEVPPVDSQDSDKCILLCENCDGQINHNSELDLNHWRCLNDSMWSTVPVVQVVAWRMLKKLSADAGWAQDLLDMLYFDDEMQKWAEAYNDDSDDVAVDSNGAVLAAGDNVTLIKDLEVKGANFTAKRGTAVRGISLTQNPEHIEGRVNGTRIVILTQYVKKSN